MIGQNIRNKKVKSPTRFARIYQIRGSGTEYIGSNSSGTATSGFLSVPSVQTGMSNRSRENIKRIGTWNVNSLGQRYCENDNRSTKLESIKIEMRRMKIGILGLSEINWSGKDDFWSDEFRVIYSGEMHAGVGLIVNREWGNRVKSVVLYSGRIIMVRFDCEPRDLVVIQVYMPTSSYSDEYVEEMYEQLDEIWNMTKSSENVVVMGDWNAVVGEGKISEEVGAYGLGKRNKRGERLIQFCNEKELVISNSLFQQRYTRRYTWTHPNKDRYQLDYIMVKKRYKNQVYGSRSYPGADIDSDHNLVMMESNLILKKRNKNKKVVWNLEKLNNEEVQKCIAQDIEKKIEEVEQVSANDNINERYEVFKEMIGTAADTHLGKMEKKVEKGWMTSELKELIEERRKYKEGNTDLEKKKYNRIRNEVNRMGIKKKEEWIENLCVNVDQNFQKGNTFKAFNLIKKEFGIRKVNNNNLLGKNGELLIDEEEKNKRWAEYTEDLYNDYEDNENILENESEVEVDNIGPTILKCEFMKALKELKNRKAPGIDGIKAELLKNLGEKGTNHLFKLISEMYETGNLPQDFEKCVMIPLPKKGNATKCGEYRTLSLITHASKILTRIITRRMEGKIEENLSDDQFGFRKGMGTREAILCVRQITEKMLKIGKPTYMAFVDLEKAFDNVKWKKLFKILRAINVDFKDRRIIYNLYKNETAVFECKTGANITAKIKKGVRQGCNLSPMLFNLFIEMAIREVKMSDVGGVKINGNRIKLVRFADDIALVAESEEELTQFLSIMNNIFISYDMKINKKKTKVLVCSREPIFTNITIEGEKIEQVNTFTYLGSRITSDGKNYTDITCRIGQAKAAFYKKRKLLTCKKINLETRKHFIKSFVWSIALYGSETWTLRKFEKKRLEAFEMWCWRRLLKISWTEKVTNKEVLERVQEEKHILKTASKRRHKWIGHILRHNEYMTNILEGTLEGSSTRGRPRQQYMEDVTKECKQRNYKDMKRVASNRQKWRALNL